MCASALMIVLAVSTLQLSSILLTNDNVVYAYSNSQAQSLNNECGVDGSSGPNCANNGPQNVGDGTATALTPLQISGGQGERGPPGPPGPQGPPGPDKELQVRTVLGPEGDVEGGQLDSTSAECDPDEVVTGGGHALGGAENNIVNVPHADIGLPEMQPNAWQLEVGNPGPDEIPFRAFAECAKLVDVP